MSLGSGEFVAVADAEAEGEADAEAEALGDAVADSAAEALSEPEAEADASEVALEPQAASNAMELTPSTPSAARRVRFSDIVIPFSQSVIATSLAANPTGYRVEWAKREKRLADQSVMTNYDAAEVADASAEASAEAPAEAAAEEGAEAKPDAAALAVPPVAPPWAVPPCKVAPYATLSSHILESAW